MAIKRNNASRKESDVVREIFQSFAQSEGKTFDQLYWMMPDDMAMEIVKTILKFNGGSLTLAEPIYMGTHFGENEFRDYPKYAKDFRLTEDGKYIKYGYIRTKTEADWDNIDSHPVRDVFLHPYSREVILLANALLEERGFSKQFTTRVARELIPGLLWSVLIDDKEYLIDKEKRFQPEFSYPTYVDHQGGHHSTIVVKQLDREYRSPSENPESLYYRIFTHGELQSPSIIYDPHGPLHGKLYHDYTHESDEMIMYDKLVEWCKNSDYVKNQTERYYRGNYGITILSDLVYYKDYQGQEYTLENLTWQRKYNFLRIETSHGPFTQKVHHYAKYGDQPSKGLPFFQTIFKHIAEWDPKWSQENKDFLSSVLSDENDCLWMSKENSRIFFLSTTPTIESLMTQKISISKSEQKTVVQEAREGGIVVRKESGEQPKVSTTRRVKKHNGITR